MRDKPQLQPSAAQGARVQLFFPGPVYRTEPGCDADSGHELSTRSFEKLGESGFPLIPKTVSAFQIDDLRMDSVTISFRDRPQSPGVAKS
jgi:hypothetical protein